jgi:TonB family protein
MPRVSTISVMALRRQSSSTQPHRSFLKKHASAKIGVCSTTLKFIVETDGHVRDVQILKSCADAFKDKKDREAAETLDPEAAKAVSQYRFEPAKFQGHPVPVEFTAEVQFQVF